MSNIITNSRIDCLRWINLKRVLYFNAGVGTGDCNNIMNRKSFEKMPVSGVYDKGCLIAILEGTTSSTVIS